MAHTPPLVSIAVFDISGSVIGDAEVVLTSTDPSGSLARRIVLEFSASIGSYVAKEAPSGSYVLTTSAAGRETQRRPVAISDGGLAASVVLGRPGLPHYYRGTVKVPFERRAGLVAASIDGKAEEVDRRVEDIARRLSLEALPTSDVLRDERVRLFQMPGHADGEAETRVCMELAREPAIRFAGPVVSLRNDSLAFLTVDLVAQFRPRVDPDKAVADAGLALTVVRHIPYADNAVVMRAIGPWEALAACDVLVESDQVVYAEPSLVVTASDAQVVPTDFLFGQQWYAGVVDLPEAWKLLRLANGAAVVAGGPGDLTFGSEDLTLAVFDRGIQSERDPGGGPAVHPDFSGPVTSGAAKISVFFDFATMSPDNETLVNNHGMLSAGVASALANNPSAVAGEAEGIAGAAANCRVMAVIRPGGRPELEYADAYVWMAGFDPLSTMPDFPNQLARGADVITNSFHVSSGAPISGLMANCFDYLVTQGRKGKGVVLCFSAGNSLPPNLDFRLVAPWAAYDKTIAVAASSSVDLKAETSNFGDGIDVCAPGEITGGSDQVLTSDRPAAGITAGHTGGPNDYTTMFFGTSAATPLVAGIAALVLSANPDLTWEEVRDILCTTARRIDYGNTDPIGEWTDTDSDGQPDYSQWYGFGRVDAKVAVREALSRLAVVTTGAPRAPSNVRIMR